MLLLTVTTELYALTEPSLFCVRNIAPPGSSVLPATPMHPFFPVNHRPAQNGEAKHQYTLVMP